MAPGCGFLGGTPIEIGRGRFNDAVQVTSKQQLLLNLVRLRYGDTPVFLEVSNVTGSYSYSASVGGNATVPTTGIELFGVSAGTAISEAPTISYTPLQGEQFARELLKPLDLDALLLLYHSGWPINRILRVCVQRMNGVPNAESAAGPILDEKPAYEDFARMTWNLRYLQQDGALELGRLKRTPKPETSKGEEKKKDKSDSDEPVEVALRISKGLRESPAANEFTQALGIDIGLEEYVLTQGVAPGRTDQIAVVTRSLMAVLFYLSKAVDVPAEDDEAGLTVMKMGADPAEWQRAFEGIFLVRHAHFCPGNAFAAVSYLGRCFYVAQDDVESKATFSLVTQLLALQANPVAVNVPTLTIPLGR